MVLQRPDFTFESGKAVNSQESEFHFGSRPGPGRLAVGWTRTRIQDSPVPARAALQEENWEPFSKGNRPVLESQLACVRACMHLHMDVSLCVHVCRCVRLHMDVSLCVRVCRGGGWGGTSRPSPSAASLPAASPTVCCGRCLAVPWQRRNRMYLWIAAGTSPSSQAAHTVPLPKGLLRRRTAWVQVGDKWYLCPEGGRDGILHGVSGGEGRGEEEEDTRVHSPAEALLWELAAASLCPTEDAKETAWEEELPSTGLVCGRLIAVFPTITVAPHGGRALCQDMCSVLRLANI